MHLSRRKGILLVLAMIYGLAWFLPRLLISNGLETLSPDQQSVAGVARGLAWNLCWENILQRLCIARVKTEVLSVGVPQETPGEIPSGWVVRVSAYGLFGILYAQVIFANEDGLSQDSCFAGQAAGALGFLVVLVCTVIALVMWPRSRRS